MKYLLKALHRQELEGFLRESGLIDQIKSKKTQCNICGTTIDITNLGAIARDEGKVIFFCDSHHWEQPAFVVDRSKDGEEQ